MARTSNPNYKYYVLGHYPSSYLYLKHRPVAVLDEEKTMDNVQKHNICTNVPSSQILDRMSISGFNYNPI
jgi:hypothetical protein